jgi:hypothetical protein
VGFMAWQPMNGVAFSRGETLRHDTPVLKLAD